MLGMMKQQSQPFSLLWAGILITVFGILVPPITFSWWSLEAFRHIQRLV